MNRRSFVRKLAGIGLFTILPGAGRIWKAERQSPYRWLPNDVDGYLRTTFQVVRQHDLAIIEYMKTAGVDVPECLVKPIWPTLFNS